MRPGRFDREVTIGIPDIKEREEMLRLHAKNKPLSGDIDFKVLARRTPGFTPADLENILNEAALLSARKNHKNITMKSIEEATTKVIAGVEKKSRVVSESERRITAYHESGHALLARLLPDMDPVHQVTIIPRGRAGGFTMQLPSEDRSYMTKKRMEKDLIVFLGGRIAEKIILDDISTGAQNDLSRVTKVARAMVTKYAMSENLSQMSYEDGEEVFLGRDMTTKQNYSEHVAAEIDREVRRIVDNAYDEAYGLLSENIDKLHDMASALLEYETIHSEEFELVFTEGFEALKEVKLKEEEAEEEARVKEEAKEAEAAEKAKEIAKLEKEMKDIAEEKAKEAEIATDDENTHS